MLDIELFRTNLDKIIESERKRFKDPFNAEKVLEFDEKWRESLQHLEELRKKRNEISVNIGKYKKSGDKKKADEVIEESKIIKKKIDSLEKLKSIKSSFSPLIGSKVGKLYFIDTSLTLLNGLTLGFPAPTHPLIKNIKNITNKLPMIFFNLIPYA